MQLLVNGNQSQCDFETSQRAKIDLGKFSSVYGGASSSYFCERFYQLKYQRWSNKRWGKGEIFSWNSQSIVQR